MSRASTARAGKSEEARWRPPLGGAVLTVLVVLLLVGPITVTLMRANLPLRVAREELLTVLLPAVAVGLSTVWRRRGVEGLATGILLGTGVGWAMAAVIGFTSLRGFALLIPPAVALALGLLDGIGEQRLAAGLRLWTRGALLGFFVSAGLMFRQGWTIVLLGAAIGLASASWLELRRDPDRGWLGGLRVPSWPPLVAAVAVLGVSYQGLLGEFSGGKGIRPLDQLGPHLGAATFLALTFVVLPALATLSGVLISRWLRPRLHVFVELTEYLRVIWLPFGAFGIGSALLVLVFGGIYGSLARIDAAHFQAAELPQWFDFAFLAVASALGREYPALQPASALCNAVVSAQAILSVGWAVVGFAAVMSYLQPKLESLRASKARETTRPN